jgi:hypothetical protein
MFFPRRTPMVRVSFHLAVLILALSSISQGTALADDDAGAGTISNKIQTILSSFDKLSWARTRTEHIKEILKGSEEEAVRLCLTGRILAQYPTNYEEYVVADMQSAVLGIFERETLSELQKLETKNGGLTTNEQFVALYWARYVSSVSSLCWVVDRTIDSDGPLRSYTQEELNAIDRETDSLWPLRPCDAAYNTVKERVKSDQGWKQIAAAEVDEAIKVTDWIDSRNEKLKVFRVWWKENKDLLRWSDKYKGFIVNTKTPETSNPIGSETNKNAK